MPELKYYFIVSKDKQDNVKFVSGFGIKDTYDSSLNDTASLDNEVLFSQFGVERYNYDIFLSRISKIQGRKSDEARQDLNSLIEKLKD